MFNPLNKILIWDGIRNVINEAYGTENSYQGFYKKLAEILDLMAPYRK